jgi:hypothetical protein
MYYKYEGKESAPCPGVFWMDTAFSESGTLDFLFDVIQKSPSFLEFFFCNAT